MQSFSAYRFFIIQLFLRPVIAADKGFLNSLFRKKPVFFRMAVSIAMHLVFPVFPHPVQIEFRQKDPLFSAGLQNTNIPRTRHLRQIYHPVKCRRSSVTVRLSVRVIAGGDPHHIFERPAPQLCKTVDFHWTGVGYQNDFRALQHQNPCAFGKFPVITNHGAHLHGAAGGVQRGGEKPAAARKGPFRAKIAGVHLVLRAPCAHCSRKVTAMAI